MNATKEVSRYWTPQQIDAADTVMNAARHLRAALQAISDEGERREEFRLVTAGKNPAALLGLLTDREPHVTALLELAWRAQCEISRAAEILAAGEYR